jgi:phospholipid transport system substrate-binding protein
MKRRLVIPYARIPYARIPYARAIATAVLVAAALASAPRSEAAQDAGGFISRLGNEAIQMLDHSVPPTQRAARFRQLFESDFDLPELARFVLGPYGRSLTPAQQQEFLGLFRESLVQAYSDKLARYSGEPFRVTGSRPSGDETIVTSEVRKSSGTPVAIDWHVADRGGRDLVTDVAIDGVSMKVAQRDAFAGIIQRNGGRADSLLAALRQQLTSVPKG